MGPGTLLCMGIGVDCPMHDVYDVHSWGKMCRVARDCLPYASVHPRPTGTHTHVHTARPGVTTQHMITYTHTNGIDNTMDENTRSQTLHRDPSPTHGTMTETVPPIIIATTSGIDTQTIQTTCHSAQPDHPSPPLQPNRIAERAKSSNPVCQFVM